MSTDNKHGCRIMPLPLPTASTPTFRTLMESQQAELLAISGVHSAPHLGTYARNRSPNKTAEIMEQIARRMERQLAQRILNSDTFEALLNTPRELE